MDKELQRAIDALSIEDVSIRTAAASLLDGYDPKFDPEIGTLRAELSHSVKGFEVVEVDRNGDSSELFLRVLVELTVRWKPDCGHSEGDAEEPREKPESSTHVAFIEALMVADYSIDPDPGQEALERFALQNASFHVWPYWREYLANQCRRMNLPPVMLPMHQFTRPKDNSPDDSS